MLCLRRAIWHIPLAGPPCMLVASSHAHLLLPPPAPPLASLLLLSSGTCRALGRRHMQQSSRKRLCSSVVHEQENERGCKPATDLCKDSEAFLVAHGLQALLHPCLLPASFW